MILLDTDIMIDLSRKYQPAVAWLASLGDEEIALPGFVVMELIQGCRNKLEQEKVEKTLTPYSVMWPSLKACDEALSAFARYHLSHSLGLLDALIGEAAVTLNLPLHTFNQKHYAPIPNLKTIQPYAKGITQP
jgi:predicted nucleic acid-binding protein